MKIVVLSHSCIVDVNQQLLESIVALPDVQLLLISPANWISDVTGKPVVPQNLPDAHFEIVRANIAFPGNINLHFYPQFPDAALRKFDTDVIYSTQEPFSVSNYQALSLARRLKKAFVFHTNQNIYKAYPPPFSWMESVAFQSADYALGYSQEAVDVMAQKKRVGKSAVVPYATDVSRFIPNASDKAAVRKAQGIEESDIVFGFLGRLVPEKGLADLLSATASLFRQDTTLEGRVKLLIVGSGSEEANLRQQAEQLGIAGKVIFAGVVPHREAARYMNALDVFVLPSRTLPNWKEQFGRVIIEAMACHIPVIGSDSGEIPHLIRATQGGLVFREGDTEDLASKMHELCRDLPKRTLLGQQGAKAVADRYSLEAVATKLVAIFQEAIQDHSRKNRG